MMRIMRALRIVFLVVPLLLAAAPADGQVLTIDELADRMARKISSIRTLRQKAAWTMQMEMGGMVSKTEMAEDIVFERPNRLNYRSHNSQLVSDGRNLYHRSSMTGKYKQKSIDQSLAQTLAESEGLLEAMTDKEALLSDDPKQKLLAITDIAGVEILPDEDRAGRAHWVVRINLKSGPLGRGGQMSPIKIWIDQQTGLVRAAASEGSNPATPSAPAADTEDEEEENPAAPILETMKFTYQVLSSEIDQPVSDSDFHFVPGPRDKKVEPDADFAGRPPVSSRQIERFALSGQPAPDFELALLEGPMFKLSEKKGSVVVIDFWATWCGPCLRALPHMRDLETRFSGKNVVFLGISTDRLDQAAKVKEVWTKHEIGYACGIDVSQLGKLYKVHGIPCVVLIDQNGVVQGRRVGFSETSHEFLKADIETLLSGKSLAVDTGTEWVDSPDRAESDPPTRQIPVYGFDKKFFVKKWAVPLDPPPQRVRFSERISVRLTTRDLVTRSSNTITLMDGMDGHLLHTVTLPFNEPPENADREILDAAHLRSSAGGIFAAVVKNFSVSERHGRPRRSWESTDVIGYDTAGREMWKLELSKADRSVRSVHVLPVNDRQDMLLLHLSNRFILIDMSGRQMLDQRIQGTDRLEISDRDHNGVPEFVVMGREVACYELRLPDSK